MIGVTSSEYLVRMDAIPRLYSYIVARDYGFAPNPFHGFCTLATCKPRIRASAAIGDWIVGTGSKTKGRQGHLVYAMRVTETMSFDEYWSDIRFHQKKPNLYGSLKQAFGDNIYHRNSSSSEWKQLDSHHSHKDGSSNPRNVKRDTGVNRILVSDDFIYCGRDGRLIPEFKGVRICHTTQAHRCNFRQDTIEAFVEWIRGIGDKGYCGDPLEWK